MRLTGYLLAVDLGGTNIRIGVVSEEGEVVYQEAHTIKEIFSFDLFVGLLDKIMKQSESFLSSDENLLGIGIAAPSVNRDGVVRAPANLQWGELHLAELVEKKLRVPVMVANDANAAAYGEFRYGAARGCRNFALVTIGTGVGCGLIVDGQLIVGHNGFAGELGHTVVVPNGRACGCGRKGCLETYVSASGVCRTAYELLSLKKESSVLSKYPQTELTSELISQHAREGDALARNVYQQTGAILGGRLADLAALMDPELIVLFGGVLKAGDLLLEPTRKSFQENLLAFQKGSIQIVESTIEEDRAPLLGINALMRESLFSGEGSSLASEISFP